MADRREAMAVSAEARRLELPAALALIALTGGVGVGLLGNGLAAAWAGLMALLLIADAKLYRHLDQAEGELSESAVTRLAMWAAVLASLFAALPAMLMLDGGQAGAAAAIVLLVAGVARFCGPGASGVPRIALCGAAPLAVTLLVTPLALVFSGRPDWDAALVVVLGGFALMGYVVQARLAPGRELRADIVALTEANERALASLRAVAELNTKDSAALPRNSYQRKAA